MKNIVSYISDLFSQWCKNLQAVAAVESALVFPILLTMLLGTFDIGNAILVNQKTIRASMVVGDLVSRVIMIDEDRLNEAIQAGGLAFQPYVADDFGIDIISYRFNEDGDPIEVWRETRNMEPIENPAEKVFPLSEPHSGVIIIAANFVYEPVFAGFVVDTIPMQEIAFTKGRRSAVVCRVGFECLEE